MKKQYSQLKAMLAITIASLRAILRSPSTVVFSLGFPIIFILVFGSIGENGFSMNVGVSPASDTLNPVYNGLKSMKGITIYHLSDSALNADLKSAAITAIIDIHKSDNAPYDIKLKSSDVVRPQDLQVLKSILNAIIIQSDTSYHIAKLNPDVAIVQAREFREIDRILPGMLGFSLLGTGVFSVAFLFFNLRNQLVLKRFFATPVSRSAIILGEGLSRILFQLLSVIIIIVFGYLFFQFSFVNGVVTFIDMMLICFLACIVFMGAGFIVSSIARTDNVIPVYSNIFVFPQFLLSGTFFSISVFPVWLQQICKYLPLTCFNNAMRVVSYEGASIWSTWKDVSILLLWGVLIYVVAVKVFRWE
ncbi:ABC transporter permease [Ilyomonas limi]|uniref:Transport permease protein n=1 Tax=Ilyomonas limi TaxID=2575867 RepID=A0A4U3L2F1_9BACT|nr:ABC transporter permease [Ilyomonas limi]TKK67716.1 ABC transporter permease [Ilyomonas limi]